MPPNGDEGAAYIISPPIPSFRGHSASSFVALRGATKLQTCHENQSSDM